MCEWRTFVAPQGKGERGTPNEEQLAASLKILREDTQLNAEAPADDQELLKIWRDAVTATGSTHTSAMTQRPGEHGSRADWRNRSQAYNFSPVMHLVVRLAVQRRQL